MRVLDLFSGAGGSAMGYHRAGYEVVGVDHKPQPHYPFSFIKGDAFEVFQEMGHTFDLIHASPPCQGYSQFVTSDGRWSDGKHNGINEPRLIPLLKEVFGGTPYIIENVRGAKEELGDPFMLCGAMFGLSTPRHRYFATNLEIGELPLHAQCRNLTHPVAEEWIAIDPKHRNRRIYSVTGKSRQTGSVAVWRTLMDMPWIQSDFEIAPAIPPAYTEWIGNRIKEELYAKKETST